MTILELYLIRHFTNITCASAEQRFGRSTVGASGEIVHVTPGRTPLQMLALAGAIRSARVLVEYFLKILYSIVFYNIIL
jgi:hypothetical protein